MPKKKTPTKPASANKTNAYEAPDFLVDLLNARSPTGHEFEAQAVVDRYVEQKVDAYRRDTMGNRFATVNRDGDPSVLFAGHIDELGLIITYINEKGFLYFDTLGGHDKSMISGRRVTILTKDGEIKGVTGKRAIHLMSPEDRKKVPETHQIWIDIGVKSREEAEALVRIGDPAVYDQSFELVRGSVGVARAFDDKAGAYAVLEAVRRLTKGKLNARVTAAATTQEEIGTRGAMTAAFSSVLISRSRWMWAMRRTRLIVTRASMGASSREVARSCVAAQTSTRSFSTESSSVLSRRRFLTKSRRTPGRPARMRARSKSRGRVSRRGYSRYLYATCTPRVRWSTWRTSSGRFSCWIRGALRTTACRC